MDLSMYCCNPFVSNPSFMTVHRPSLRENRSNAPSLMWVEQQLSWKIQWGIQQNTHPLFYSGQYCLLRAHYDYTLALLGQFIMKRFLKMNSKWKDNCNINRKSFFVGLLLLASTISTSGYYQLDMSIICPIESWFLFFVMFKFNLLSLYR